MKPIVLTIAGFDTSGGAGVQSDVKALTSLGVHAVTVATSIAIQNTQTVKYLHPLPGEIVSQQIDALVDDFPISIVKTGLLPNEDIIKCVAEKTRQYNWRIIVDPVFTSTTGTMFSTSSSISKMKTILLPETYLITPNKEEAEYLTGITINSIEDIKKAAEELHQLGAKNIFIKGGHMEKPIDVFYDGKNFKTFYLPKLSKTVHGTGCTLAAFIAGFLALDKPITEAVEKSKNILWHLILNSEKLGKGIDILFYPPNANLGYETILDEKQVDVIIELQNVIPKILDILPADYIPEVGINIGYATSNAKDKKDICAIKGRIINSGGKAKICGGLSFGASNHISAIILSAMKYYPHLRSAMNIKYISNILEKCREAGLSIGSFDRKKEPSTSTSTMEWGTSAVLRKTGKPLDLIYDLGGHGKEAMIRILGNNPEDILKKLNRILGRDG
ncbi:MAG: bifunctional hydroxymethylpyrimidine kinase/phosphomethylpyrimidine kinase [Thermoplasmata archaeon]|nr:MAG: bifunctional hydroxymethylpyrimidine kinase/phosphomethylpyrimidine kinase [Thermoplasmata archaeon]